MGAMASRGQPAVAPEPVDAPTPPLPHPGVTFKDAVTSEPTPAGKRGASPGRAKGAAGSPGKGGGGSTEMTPTRGGGEEKKSVTEAVAETTEAAARKTVAVTGLWRPFRFLARTSNKGVDKLTHSKRFVAAVRAFCMRVCKRASARARVHARVLRPRGACPMPSRRGVARGARGAACAWMAC
jgi:hypothetical protein